MSQRKNIASNTFISGSNCAQSVLCAFKDVLDKEESELKAMAASFGGGMGKMQLTCGAVTGSFILFGLYAGRHTNDNAAAKDLSVEMVREFAHRFKQKNGSLTCRDIVGVDLNSHEGQTEANEKNVFGTVCVNAVENAVEIITDILEKQESKV